MIPRRQRGLLNAELILISPPGTPPSLLGGQPAGLGPSATRGSWTISATALPPKGRNYFPLPARLSVTARTTGRAVIARDLTVAWRRQRVALGVLLAGTYDLLISAGADTDPLSDVLVLVVAGPDGADATDVTEGHP